MKNLKLVLGLALAFALAACGDDEVKSGGSVSCGEGEVYNPILQQCEPANFNNSNGNVAPGNVDPGNQATNSNTGNVNPGNVNPGNNTTDMDAGTPTNNNSGNEDSGFNAPDLPCGNGSLVGRACAPSGEVLAAADVTISGVDCDGNAFEVTTRTTGDGTFQFDEVPSGTHELEVTSGSFSSTRTVFVRAGILNDYTSASEKICVDSNVKLAVIEGAYDKVEDVLSSLNLQYDVMGADQDDFSTPADEVQETIDFLSNVSQTSQYDVLLINCGNLYNRVTDRLFGIELYPGSFQAIVSGLQAFVAQGGSLYVSDWASPFFEAAFPNLVEFYGDDTAYEAARWGFAPQVINATVSSQALQTTLGANTATIDFPHNPPAVYNDHWVVPTGVGANVTVHLEGDAVLCQNQNCMSGGQTATASPLLSSYKDPNGGTVIFTSFHNHSDPSAPITPEMEKILRFLILQL